VGDSEGDRETAEAFYFGLLGLVPDPRLPGQCLIRRLRLFRTYFLLCGSALVSLLLIKIAIHRNRYRKMVADDTGALLV
jgi:hypothetical protein